MPGEFLLIGLGLAHPSDISVRALKHLRTSCGLSPLPPAEGEEEKGTLREGCKVYLECYTRYVRYP
jgi:diphthamide biosynthesis methyltransferase